MHHLVSFTIFTHSNIWFVLFQAKKLIAEDMASKDGEIKLLLATEAYGMGVDTPDIRRIVHAGPPCTLESKCTM